MRADVVVRGPRVEAALTHFADLLEADLAELVEVRNSKRSQCQWPGCREAVIRSFVDQVPAEHATFVHFYT